MVRSSDHNSGLRLEAESGNPNIETDLSKERLVTACQVRYMPQLRLFTRWVLIVAAYSLHPEVDWRDHKAVVCSYQQLGYSSATI